MVWPKYQIGEHLTDTLRPYPWTSKKGLLSWPTCLYAKKLIDPYIVAIDSTLLKAKGHVWHKSSMNKRAVQCSGIDTDARWWFSHTKGWIFGYKLHMISSTGSTIVLLAADFTTANVQDNQLYNPMTASSSSLFTEETYFFMIGRWFWVWRSKTISSWHKQQRIWIGMSSTKIWTYTLPTD